jgi:hypothetical protein
MGAVRLLDRHLAGLTAAHELDQQARRQEEPVLTATGRDGSRYVATEVVPGEFALSVVPPGYETPVMLAGRLSRSHLEAEIAAVVDQGHRGIVGEPPLAKVVAALANPETRGAAHWELRTLAPQARVLGRVDGPDSGLVLAQPRGVELGGGIDVSVIGKTDGVVTAKGLGTVEEMSGVALLVETRMADQAADVTAILANPAAATDLANSLSAKGLTAAADGIAVSIQHPTVTERGVLGDTLATTPNAPNGTVIALDAARPGLRVAAQDREATRAAAFAEGHARGDVAERVVQFRIGGDALHREVAGAAARNELAAQELERVTYLDVRPIDQQRALDAGAALSPSNAALYIPRDAGPAVARTLVDRFGLWEEAHAKRMAEGRMLDVPRADIPAAALAGAEYDAVSGRMYVPQDATPSQSMNLQRQFGEAGRVSAEDRASGRSDAERFDAALQSGEHLVRAAAAREETATAAASSGPGAAAAAGSSLGTPAKEEGPPRERHIQVDTHGIPAALMSVGENIVADIASMLVGNGGKTRPSAAAEQSGPAPVVTVPTAVTDVQRQGFLLPDQLVPLDRDGGFDHRLTATVLEHMADEAVQRSYVAARSIERQGTSDAVRMQARAAAEALTEAATARGLVLQEPKLKVDMEPVKKRRSLERD